MATRKLPSGWRTQRYSDHIRSPNLTAPVIYCNLKYKQRQNLIGFDVKGERCEEEEAFKEQLQSLWFSCSSADMTTARTAVVKESS